MRTSNILIVLPWLFWGEGVVADGSSNKLGLLNIESEIANSSNSKLSMALQRKNYTAHPVNGISLYSNDLLFGSGKRAVLRASETLKGLDIVIEGGNLLEVQQLGAKNAVSVEISGADNEAYVWQTGIGQQAAMSQTGQFNSVVIRQGMW